MADSQTLIKPNTTLKEPPLYRVIYVNDEKTTMEFVIKSLIDHFDYTKDTAAKLMSEIHSQGSQIVAVLPFEIAEQKGIDVTIEARQAGFPLQIKIEPDDKG